MKKTIWIVLFVALTLTAGGFVLKTQAQQPAAQPAAPPSFVAVVDVAQLIKAHPEFNQKQEVLKKEALTEEAKFQERQKVILDQEAKLKNSGLKPGTPEHTKAVEDIQNAYTDYEKDVRSMQRRLALQNSQIMFDTYKDIKRTIGAFAKARRIAQVTDYRFFEPNPAEPNTVMEDLEQKLVWFDESLDITKYVIAQMYAERNMQVPQNVLQATTPNATGARQ